MQDEKMYRQFGRMFLHQDKAPMLEQLEETAKKSQKEIKTVEDTMTYFDGKDRNAESWQATRLEVSQCMAEISGQDLWHDCFKACQEAAAEPKVSTTEPKVSIGTKTNSLGATLRRKAAEALGLMKDVAKKAVCLATPAEKRQLH